MTTAIYIAIAIVLAPAVLGWIWIIRTLLRAYADRCERKAVAKVQKISANIVAGKYARTPLTRARQLRQWVRLHGNCEIVKLKRGGPA